MPPPPHEGWGSMELRAAPFLLSNWRSKPRNFFLRPRSCLSLFLSCPHGSDSGSPGLFVYPARFLPFFHQWPTCALSLFLGVELEEYDLLRRGQRTELPVPLFFSRTRRQNFVSPLFSHHRPDEAPFSLTVVLSPLPFPLLQFLGGLRSLTARNTKPRASCPLLSTPGKNGSFLPPPRVTRCCE